LPLEIVSKGRFEKSEPTIYHGEDLDVPTYIRRGVPLNRGLGFEISSWERLSKITVAFERGSHSDQPQDY
jgi:hypothetical protein